MCSSLAAGYHLKSEHDQPFTLSIFYQYSQQMASKAMYSLYTCTQNSPNTY